MRNLTVPTITDSKRFFPKPELLTPLERRWLEDGYGEIWNPEQEAWEYAHPICLHVLDALENGLDLDQMAEAFPTFDNPPITRTAAKKLARKYIWQLVRRGHVHLELEQPPDVFNGRYRRVRELGRGGLGIASLCEDMHEDNRLVVVKHPWGVLNNIKSGQECLAMEIDVLSRCDHPALPRLYDSFVRDGLLHMVRDFVDGEPVLKTYKGKGIKDRAERLDVARQAASGVHHLHERGFLLLDAGPANYMRLADGRIMITDVGACEPFDGNVALVQGMRSAPGYTPPEMRAPQEDGFRHLDLRSDVHVFGLFYYFLCTGDRPKRTWRAADLKQDLEARGLAVEDRAIIEACTPDNMDERPANMMEVLELLK